MGAGCGAPGLWGTAAVLFLLLSVAASPAQTSPPSELQVKAAIIVNLPKYVEWPEQSFASSNSPIVLAVLGPANLEEALRRMVAGKVVGGRRLECRWLEPGKPAQFVPHVLFVSGSDPGQAKAVLRAHLGQPVLTVVDGQANRAEGTVITLVRKDNKVRLEINLTTANEAGLSISSKLLSVADVVKGRAK